MAKVRKKLKKGFNFSEYFKELKVGDKVALVRNPTATGMFPKQFSGRTGHVQAKYKEAYAVKFLNGKRYKTLIVKPIHLKKIK
jgi:large subunit ribosomal protein L21e